MVHWCNWYWPGCQKFWCYQYRYRFINITFYFEFGWPWTFRNQFLHWVSGKRWGSDSSIAIECWSRGVRHSDARVATNLTSIDEYTDAVNTSIEYRANVWQTTSKKLSRNYAGSTHWPENLVEYKVHGVGVEHNGPKLHRSAKRNHVHWPTHRTKLHWPSGS